MNGEVTWKIWREKSYAKVLTNGMYVDWWNLTHTCSHFYIQECELY